MKTPLASFLAIVTAVLVVGLLVYSVSLTRSSEQNSEQLADLQSQNRDLQDNLKVVQDAKTAAAVAEQKAYNDWLQASKTIALLKSKVDQGQNPRAQRAETASAASKNGAPTPAGATTGPLYGAMPPSSMRIGTVNTTDGKVLREARILKVDPDAVTVLDDQGLAIVDTRTLPSSLQERLNYDADRAREAREARLREDEITAGVINQERARGREESIAVKNQDDFSRFAVWMDGRVARKGADGYVVHTQASTGNHSGDASIPYLPAGTYRLVTTETYSGHVHVKVYPINGMTFSDDMADAYELRK